MSGVTHERSWLSGKHRDSGVELPQPRQDENKSIVISHREDDSKSQDVTQDMDDDCPTPLDRAPCSLPLPPSDISSIARSDYSSLTTSSPLQAATSTATLTTVSTSGSGSGSGSATTYTTQSSAFSTRGSGPMGIKHKLVWDAGVGFTQAIMVFKIAVKSYRQGFLRGDALHSFPHGDTSDCNTLLLRLADLEKTLRNIQLYVPIYTVASLSVTAITIIKRHQNNLTRCRSHTLAIDALEEDMRDHGFFPPDYSGRWSWDPTRGLWYRWATRAQRYEYSNGETMSCDEWNRRCAAADQTW